MTAWRGIGKALSTAALSLPGIAASLGAAAQTAPPEAITVGMRWLEYQDYGSDDKLMGVRAPYFHAEAPVAEDWGVEASVLVDSIAGATPLAPVAAGSGGGGSGAGSGTDTVSGASGAGGRRSNRLSAAAAASPGTVNLDDRRTAVDARATRYFERAALGFGFAFSDEVDWTSVAGSADLRLSTADNNRTYALGLGYTADRIGSVLDPGFTKSRSTWEVLAGVTQVLSQTQAVQSNLAMSAGSGRFSDVYRSGDVRPDSRVTAAWLTRYRHYVPAADAAIHADYRLFADDWGLLGHTVELAWYQPVGETWMVRPFLRYHSQDAAGFYDPGAAPATAGGTFSNDPRLGAFGALAPGLAVEKSFEGGWTVQLYMEYYERNADWHLTGNGSDGLAGLNAYVVTLGLRKAF